MQATDLACSRATLVCWSESAFSHIAQRRALGSVRASEPAGPLVLRLPRRNT